MRKISSARRVPRKVGQGADEDDEVSSALSADQDTGTPVRRPAAKVRKSSALRTSLGPSTLGDEDDSEVSVVSVKRSNLSKVAIQRSASKRSGLHTPQLPVRQSDAEDDRPDYSAASLRELKDSTPATPQQFNSPGDADVEDLQSDTQALDISAKFGSSLSRYQESSAHAAIPSAAEIAEKKARRARLAKEQQAEEFISLDPDDPDLDDDGDDDNVMKDEHGRLVLKPKDKYGLSESRLVPDDEDIMENFDDFTEDGKISLGRKAEAEAARKRKQDMAAQIAEAEGASDLDSDDSEHERNAAFEAAQTKHGIYIQNATDSDPSDARPKTPPIITPIPTLNSVVERLRKQVADMQSSRMQKLREMENLQREKVRLAEEEVRIQRALKETSEKFEQLRREKGIIAVNKEHMPAIAAPSPPMHTAVSRQTMGSDDGPEAGSAAQEDGDDNESDEDKEEEEEEEEEEEGPGFAGLGFGGARQGFGAGLGFGASAATEKSDNDMST